MIDFPANPVTGQTFTAGGYTWAWDGAKWTGTTASGGGGASISISDTPPANPTLGAMWWDSVGGQLYVYYYDGNTFQWVPTTNQMGGAYLPLSGGFMTGPITLSADPVSALQPVSQQYFAARPMIGDNRIINGDMRIDQRNNGAAGTAVNVYTVDRWTYSASQAGKFDWGRNNVNLAWFPYALAFVAVGGWASAANDSFSVFQPIEADMISDFAWGTANAQPVTLSFWAASSLTGTFSGAVKNYAATRSYPFTFSIPTAATWTKITLTIPGDTGGTWVMSGNAGALYVQFDLGCGANNRGPANVWASAAYSGVTGSVSVVATNNANFFLTGVKLEVGSVATPYNRQSLAKSMADCQRYYQITANVQPLVSGWQNGVSNIFTPMLFPVSMRVAPTIAYSSIAYTNASALVVGGLSQYQITHQTTLTATGFGFATAIFSASAEF
jgi:hypothetical protein